MNIRDILYGYGLKVDYTPPVPQDAPFPLADRIAEVEQELGIPPAEPAATALAAVAPVDVRPLPPEPPEVDMRIKGSVYHENLVVTGEARDE